MSRQGRLSTLAHGDDDKLSPPPPLRVMIMSTQEQASIRTGTLAVPPCGYHLIRGEAGCSPRVEEGSGTKPSQSGSNRGCKSILVW